MPVYRLRFRRRGKLQRACERHGGQHVRRSDAADRGNGRNDRPVFRGGHHRRFSLPKHGSRRHGQNNAGQNDRRLQYGYNRASMDVALSDVEINMIRRSDKKTLVGYAFLGMDVWHPTGGYWVNCMDAGLKYDGNSGKWVLFHFIYDVSAANQQKWYESHKALDPTHDYRISLDCSKSEGWTTLSAYDLTEGREADSVTFQARYAKKDGSNVSFYQDFAIDMPDDLMRDPDGNIYEVDSAISDEGWAGIILYSTNEDVYLRNLKVVNSMLNGQPWTADKTRLRGFSPDSLQPYIGYEVVKVTHANFDNEFQVDIDLKK